MPERKPIETREEAMAEANRRFGDRGCVGGPGRPAANWTGGDVYWTGWKEVGEWQWIGTGATWDEAFASVKRVNTRVKDKLVTFA